jgi:hypothetical protein
MLLLNQAKGERTSVKDNSDAFTRSQPVEVQQDVTKVKQIEEDQWYRNWVDRNTIRHERTKAAGA